MERTYFVEGMTCGHCTAAVKAEVERVPGVEAVEVALDTGAVTVRGERVDDAEVRAAVEQAGYAVCEA